MRINLFFLYVFFAYIGFSQTLNLDTISIKAKLQGIIQKNNEKSILIVGENHFRNNLAHKTELINYTENLKFVVLEAPLIYEYYCNKFVLEGDEEVFLYSTFFRNYKDEFEGMLKTVRLKNLTLPINEKIKIGCFDVSFLDFTPTKELLLGVLKKIEQEGKFNALKILRESTTNNKTPFEITQALNYDLMNHDSLYKNTLSDFYPLYQMVIEGMQISYSKTQLSSTDIFILREAYITKLVNKKIDELKQNEKIIIFCGNIHASKLKNDDLIMLSDGKGFISFTSILYEKYPNEIFSIIVQYSKKRNFFFGETNYLDIPHKNIFKDKTEAYRIYYGEDLKTQEFASMRCDMLIVKNLNFKY